jgi:hypothetical protein
MLAPFAGWGIANRLGMAVPLSNGAGLAIMALADLWFLLGVIWFNGGFNWLARRINWRLLVAEPRYYFRLLRAPKSR